MHSDIKIFLDHFQSSVDNNTFQKLTLSKPGSKSGELKNVYARLVEIKGALQLSFTHRYESRDEVKNYPVKDSLSKLEEWLGNDFLQAHLYSTEADYTLLFNKKRKPRLLTSKASSTAATSRSHDKTKKRMIASNQNTYLYKLGICSRDGQVLKSGQRKFRQINRYIEILDSLIKDTFEKKEISVLDVGCGKGYLTFALYDYLQSQLNKQPKITGIELRQELVDLTNKIARESSFDQLQYLAQDINDFQTQSLDILIALHACDIATDIAIAKGIKAKAQLIVVAPCCHKQIRKEIHCASELAPILQHGILEERQAEIITDGIRALLMEAHGYTTKVFEFISTEHTSKNLMIVGTKGKKNADVLEKIEAIKKAYGIKSHYLETLLA